MSDMQTGPGWWQASDGKWYPPELHPARQAPFAGQPPGGAPTGYQPWGPGYSPYGMAAAGSPYGPPRRTNGLAIASLACSVGGIVPFFFGVPCVVGIVLGFVSLGQIKRSTGTQQGRGLAIAGVSVGFALIAIFIVLVVGFSVTASHNGS